MDISELPKIYEIKHFNETDVFVPNIVLLAGTHGNELGPVNFLYTFIKDRNFWKKTLQKGHYYIIPEVNPLACTKNVRNLDNQPDVNRSWPSEYSINVFLTPLIKKADIIIDIHEGYDYNACNPGSLGNTVFSNVQFLSLVVKRIANMINKYKKDDCAKWQTLEKLPDYPNTLGAFANAIGKTYILIEVAGQDKNISQDEKNKDLTNLVFNILSF